MNEKMTTSLRWVAVLLLLAALAPRPSSAARASGGTVALVNVRVVSMQPSERKATKKRQTVIVEDGRITEIGKASTVEVPEGAVVIEGRNKLWVLPGLADMHMHLADLPRLPENVGPEDIYTLYFANGVTTLLDMSGFQGEFKWRKDIEKGRVVGPDLHIASPIIDEEDYATLGALENDIRKYERQGYDYIKSHTVTSIAFFDRIFEVAREVGLSVVAHALRPGFDLQETLDREPLMIAHIEEILSASVSGQFNTPSQLEEPLEAVANSRVWVTGTVNNYEVIANTRDDGTFQALLDRPEMRFLPPSVRDAWENDNRYRRTDFSGSRDFWLSQLDTMLFIARRLEQLGSLDRLLLGTDTGIDGVVPGFSTHDELRLLVEAGLKPREAIQAGTYNAAVFLDKIDEFGTVEVGKRADLLVANKNPLKKIGNLQDLAGVMANGVWMAEADLEQALEELAARWEE
jgi:hypothetical protein